MASLRGAMQRPLRVIFKEILAGDRRKFVAESNDTASGGGARDLRFNHKGLGPIFGEMFPRRETFSRRREGRPAQITSYVGKLTWPRDARDPYGAVDSMDIYYEPPTTARQGEGRIARVHTYPAFQRFPQESKERVFLLLVQTEDTAVWPFFIPRKDLTNEAWLPTIPETILDCIATTPSHQAVQGYIDLTTNDTYCNARDRDR